jgi:hypothetical protein
MFRNLAEEVDAVERAALDFAAQMHLNKAQLMSRVSQASAHPELPPVLALPKAPYIVRVMPEEAFCYVVSVNACTFRPKTHQCECSKTMKFGESIEVCKQITKRSTPSKCADDWDELSKECDGNLPVSCKPLPTEAQADVLEPYTNCAELEGKEACYKNRSQFLEGLLNQIIRTLTGKTLNQVEIIGENDAANL